MTDALLGQNAARLVGLWFDLAATPHKSDATTHLGARAHAHGDAERRPMAICREPGSAWGPFQRTDHPMPKK